MPCPAAVQRHLIKPLEILPISHSDALASERASLPFNIGVPQFFRSTAARARRPLTEHHMVLIATMRASQDCASKLYRLLQRVAEPTRAEVGCLAYDVHRSSEDSDLFFVYQLWEDEETFEDHRHTDHAIAFRSAAPELLEGAIQLHKWKILP